MESTNLQSQYYHLQEDQFLHRHPSSPHDSSPSIFLKGGLFHDNSLMEAEVQNNTKELFWPSKFSSEEQHHHLNTTIPPIMTTQNLMVMDTPRNFFNMYQQEASSRGRGLVLHEKAAKNENNNISDYSLPRLSEAEEDPSNQQHQEHQRYHFSQSNLWSTCINNNNFSSLSTYAPQNNNPTLAGVVSANGSYVDANNTTQGDHFCGTLGHNFLGLNLSSFDHLLASTSPTFYLGDKVAKQNQRTYWGQDGKPIMSRLLKDHNTSNNNTLKLFNNGPSKIGKKSSTHSTITKKPHVEAKKCRVSSSSSSCPPVKVSTENIRNRVAALQRLVSPFGKTDTASVLTEAIGYIQFLHDQVQTLSVPYMNSTLSQTKHSRKIENDSGQRIANSEDERDLRSRGLCLVPISYASYINDCEGGTWTMHP